MPREQSFDQGKGRGMKGGFGLGPGGDCICPSCGYKVPHKKGVPCNDTHCPHCDAILERHETIPENAGKKE